MKPISFKRRRNPPDVIRYAVWLYFRFIKFGPLIAANLRRSPMPGGRTKGENQLSVRLR